MAETASRQRTGLPLQFDAPVQCPAGRFIALGKRGASGVECRIEHSDIMSSDQSATLVSYCLNRSGYRQCPSWQAEKEHIWAGKREELVDA